MQHRFWIYVYSVEAEFRQGETTDLRLEDSTGKAAQRNRKQTVQKDKLNQITSECQLHTTGDKVQGQNRVKNQ